MFSVGDFSDSKFCQPKLSSLGCSVQFWRTDVTAGFSLNSFRKSDLSAECVCILMRLRWNYCEYSLSGWLIFKQSWEAIWGGNCVCVKCLPAQLGSIDGWSFHLESEQEAGAACSQSARRVSCFACSGLLLALTSQGVLDQLFVRF